MLNQTDHVLIQEKPSRLITSVKTCRGADTDSDHFLVRAKLKQWKGEDKEHRRNHEVRYNTEELQAQEIKTKYETDRNKPRKPRSFKRKKYNHQMEQYTTNSNKSDKKTCE